MYGSLQNSMLSTMQNTPAPEAGLPATEVWYTDRRLYTTTRVSQSGKTFWMTPIDTIGGAEIRVYLSRATGKWTSQGGRAVLVGVNDPYTGPTFQAKATLNLRVPWTRDELVIAMNLYCKLPFGRLHRRNPIIIEVAEKLGRTPSSLAMKLVNFASLDPVQQARGIKGLSGASKADREIWNEFTANWEELGIESEERFQELMDVESTESTQPSVRRKPEFSSKTPSKDLPNRIIETTEAQVTTRVRIGQNFFRQMVLSSYDNRCCITGNPIPELLIASHIIPWREHSEHRLNPRNGLCLARTHDAAFDQGLITFDENYRLVLSRYLQDFLPEQTLEHNFIAYAGDQLRSPERFQPEPDFLRYHREEIFIGA